ncbi:MAG: 1,3-beta-galactosyl-N-acetylhexosamine phosphorylase [Defluviitaleaceae bacterium]|nr:1,3-beta-galactosyl-N-acetylhexosamine phosphorylase [Defluviitaleaceae bacterium]MCL2275657.1 1,3-beta-galactosyl-N-acetylhexosamine phosphorylase [Defluviitaleaceae bacterium]
MKRKFTLPGEAGYEKLTLELAQRWGADVIRDSDGTKLSEEILAAGYEIYSTICPIREHNPWIRENMHARQQTFLSTSPQTAIGETLEITLIADFFAEQLSVNDTELAMKYWQVYDRTADELLPCERWAYENGVVTIQATPFRQYTVSFLAWRDWEEISMYNHTTNNWDKEKLMQLNPYAQGAQEYLKDWFVQWCKDHPHSNVVRFTALFYNFAWIWGSDKRNRHLFTDWASYDFTVCPEALDDFAKEYSYNLTAEDFVRQGKYFATHRVPTQKKRDWMDFIGRYVRRATRELVDIIHAAGKKAYVFYDDSWVGMEPYSGKFEEMGFDGIIKCVFSGYEIRLCADVPANVHEIRFHPYLFPVGLGGLPTFSEGGEPDKDAIRYWIQVRRALLRKKIARSGLGGYLSLTQDFPDFIEVMERKILPEFERINALHDTGAPALLAPKVAILHAWGKLRSWTLSGHFHETDSHILIHVLEALSGLPIDVQFISFEDVKNGIPADIDIIINAGEAGSAWSGGDYWKDADIIEGLTRWVHEGGKFIGIGEPSAVAGYNTYLRMAHVLGVDIDNGERTCHGKWQFTADEPQGLWLDNAYPLWHDGVYLTDGKARVIKEQDGSITAVYNPFGKGAGMYLTEFYCFDPLEAREMLNILLFAATGDVQADGVTDTNAVECAVFPKKMILINNSNKTQITSVPWQGKNYAATLAPFEMKEMPL